MSSPRIVIHVDLDYFFAQCEEKRNPNLKGKPVVVCVYSGRTSESGAVSTANYNARSFGVKSGMPIFQAKRILRDKDAAFLPVDKPYYQEISSRIMALLRGHADKFEQVGIDEAFLDVSAQSHGDFATAKKLASELKSRVYEQEGITSSVGSGPNKLVAKIASDQQKPNGLTTVAPDSILDFLAPLEVRRIVGIGKKTEQILQGIGVKTIADLRAVPAERLRELFGRTFGAYLFDAARGIDDEPVVERDEREQISRIVTLKRNSRSPEEIFPEISKLIDDVVSKAADKGLAFKTISVIGIMEDLSTHSRSETFETPLDSAESSRRISRVLLENLLSGTTLEIRRIGVKLSNFASTGSTAKFQSTLKEFLG